jgi:predicted RNA-binding protein with PIN domain
MLHIIDGYNLLFFLEIKSKTLKEARDYCIEYVKHHFESKKGVCVVFDGKQEKGLGFSRIYSGPIEIIYTIDGMSADEFIIEWFQQRKVTSKVCVYTQDLGLKRHLSEFHAQVLGFDVFSEKKKLKPSLEKTRFLSDPGYEKYLLESFTKKL